MGNRRARRTSRNPAMQAMLMREILARVARHSNLNLATNTNLRDLARSMSIHQPSVPLTPTRPTATSTRAASVPAPSQSHSNHAPLSQSSPLGSQTGAAPTANPTVKFSCLYFAPTQGLDVKHAQDGQSFKYWISIKPPQAQVAST
jgi:hypothetical protein